MHAPPPGLVDLHAELVQRVQRNLRVVLCMASFQSQDMISFMDKYPCLESFYFKHFLPWTPDVVFDIAHTQLLQRWSLMEEGAPEVSNQTLDRVAQYLSAAHCSISSCCPT